MHRDQQAELLAKWLEGTLSDTERAHFELLCVNDPEFRAQVATANGVNASAMQFESVAVPDWDRDSTFVMPEQPKWWQWQGIPAMSLALSALAMVLVVSGFHVDVKNGQMSMGFGEKGPDKNEVAAMVDDKLNQYQMANQAMFGKYVDAIAAQQKESAAQLTQYLLSSSRQERREDFAEFVKFINQQRDDDQRFMARQLNHLKQEINALETGYVTSVPITE